MRKLSLLLLSILILSPAVHSAPRSLGDVSVLHRRGMIPIEITGSPSLAALARFAFRTHGRYDEVASGSYYQMRFTEAGPNAVTVSITQGPAHNAFAAETVTGTDLTNALLRAADVAVEKTNGLGLHGYFTSRLAFVSGTGSHKDIYTSDLFFLRYQRLTNDRADALFPRWSPDGSRLLYTSYRRLFPDIYEINLRNYTLNVFESFKGTNTGARFSPDGSRVAMVLTGNSGNAQIWVSDAYGHGLHQITHFDSNAKSSPCWSPDGSRIVFASSPGPQLYVIPAYGGSPRRITIGISGYCAEPDWNRADPDKIAFTVELGGRFQIAVLSLSTGEHNVVSDASFDAIEPSWLPDGRHLVYTARNRSTESLCILDTVSGKSTPISGRFGAAEEASVWSR